MLPKRYRLMLALVFLSALLLACGLGERTPSGGTRVPVSEEAAERLEQKLKESAGWEGDDTFSLEITDVELTSYIVLQMAEQIDRPQDRPVEDFQAQFTGGQMILSGRLMTVCPFSLNARVAASARVEDGQFDLSVDKAQLGAVPMPKGLLKGLSRVVNETIAEAPERVERAVEITDVEIGEGVMRISGRVVDDSQ